CPRGGWARPGRAVSGRSGSVRGLRTARAGRRAGRLPPARAGAAAPLRGASLAYLAEWHPRPKGAARPTATGPAILLSVALGLHKPAPAASAPRAGRPRRPQPVSPLGGDGFAGSPQRGPAAFAVP